MDTLNTLNTDATPATPTAMIVDLKNSTPTAELFALEQEFYLNLRTQGKSLNTLKNYKTDLDCFNYYLNNEYASTEVKNFDQALVSNYGQYLEKKYSSDNSRRRRVHHVCPQAPSVSFSSRSISIRESKFRRCTAAPASRRRRSPARRWRAAMNRSLRFISGGSCRSRFSYTSRTLPPVPERVAHDTPDNRAAPGRRRRGHTGGGSA